MINFGNTKRFLYVHPSDPPILGQDIHTGIVDV